MTMWPWLVYMLCPEFLGPGHWVLIGRYASRATARRERTKAANLCRTRAEVVHESETKVIDDLFGWNRRQEAGQ